MLIYQVHLFGFLRLQTDRGAAGLVDWESPGERREYAWSYPGHDVSG